MNIKRLLVAGIVGAGKSSFVQTVGEMGTISTEQLATDETAALKPTTTVALDFSRVSLPTGIVHVYGTPGQARFSFMWELLLQRAHLLLVLVPVHRPTDFVQSQQIIGFIQQRSPISPVIGFTHTDHTNALPPSTVLSALGYTTEPLPQVVTVNPLDRASVLNALALVIDGVCNGC
ncbi:MAG: GTPase [Leptolyngbyaceae cyanobacterium RU_5_1]|nr:GTPase [Leptolyngbyaceae cyanobacterium RU_5_1]